MAFDRGGEDLNGQACRPHADVLSKPHEPRRPPLLFLALPHFQAAGGGRGAIDLTIPQNPLKTAGHPAVFFSEKCGQEDRFVIIAIKDERKKGKQT